MRQHSIDNAAYGAGRLFTAQLQASRSAVSQADLSPAAPEHAWHNGSTCATSTVDRACGSLGQARLERHKSQGGMQNALSVKLALSPILRLQELRKARTRHRMRSAAIDLKTRARRICANGTLDLRCMMQGATRFAQQIPSLAIGAPRSLFFSKGFLQQSLHQFGKINTLDIDGPNVTWGVRTYIISQVFRKYKRQRTSQMHSAFMR